MKRKIGLKGLFLAMISALLAGVMVFGFVAYSKLEYLRVNGPLYESVIRGKDLVADILPPPAYIIETHLTVYQLAFATDPVLRSKLIDHVMQLEKDFYERVDYWKAQPLAADIQQNLQQNVRADAKEYFTVLHEQFIPAVNSGDHEKILSALTNLQPIYDQHRQAVDVLVVLANKYSQQVEAIANAEISYGHTLLYGIFILTAVTSFLVAFWVSKHLLRVLGGEPDYAAEVVTRIATGDLSVRVHTNTGDTMSMLAAIKNMSERLEDVIADVRHSADSLASASREVNATAQELAQGASIQAASVEETSASMEEMSASIAQNNDNAGVTDNIAQMSAQHAVSGGEAVFATVEAMKKIAERISVIDEIAYQTNLLALNAAIEAGRAGEYGRGFAVVASEVRKLAERSQRAAQEISELAAASVKRAELAGNLLQEMVPSIRKTADLIQEIASASSEQTAGVHQINTAIGQVSQTMQRNAAASEELSATAEEMNTQASRLQESMTYFKLSSDKVAQNSSYSGAKNVRELQLSVKPRHL